MKLKELKDLKSNIMRSKKNKIVTFQEHLDREYGKRGTKRREKYEQSFEAFKLGVMLQQLREKNNMTQAQLAEKCGTTKNYISRIENDASDIRLSTLMRIINEGFGAHIQISVSK
jgi:HTH-type transcriptional regulator / antitoxin HipB